MGRYTSTEVLLQIDDYLYDTTVEKLWHTRGDLNLEDYPDLKELFSHKSFERTGGFPAETKRMKEYIKTSAGLDSVKTSVQRLCDLYDKNPSVLNNESVLSPSEYKKRKFNCCKTWGMSDKQSFWTPSMLQFILQDERYTGKMVARFKEKPYVGAKQRQVPKDERIVVENTHEAIISQELFDSVQAKPRIRTSPPREKRLLSGLLKCGGCKRNMVQYGKFPYALWYRCSNFGIVVNEQCCQESYREAELNEIVIAAVKNEIQKASELVDKRKSYKCKCQAKMYKKGK